ncbi:MAG: stage 0 sporulation protein J, partial [Oscillospiraceae bacterium]|nr:stage 0 sporulation protein J [Oscillospiraceae bacterium]
GKKPADPPEALGTKATGTTPDKDGEGKKPDTPPKDTPDPHQIYIHAVEQEFSTRLGRKVTIKNGAKKGRLELEFYNVDDLNDLLDQLEHILPLKKPDTQEVEA